MLKLMKLLQRSFVVTLFFIILIAGSSVAGELNSRWIDEGSSSFGLQAGWGFTDDIPSGDRTDLSFLFFFPNYQRNLTGMIGESFYQGVLNWQVEAGVASILNKDGEYLIGISPLMLQYKFLDPKRSWAPNVLVGAGIALTDWDEPASEELGGEFQFLLHGGAGLEFFQDSWSYSLNYRFLHVSNGGIETPNIGLNSHIFSLGLNL
jgi:hypothetical protein